LGRPYCSFCNCVFRLKVIERQKYQDDIFVGNFNSDRILHFYLNGQRDGLYPRGPLEDEVEHNSQRYNPVVFGRNFVRIVDLETGPDGYLYVLSLVAHVGKFYRIYFQRILLLLILLHSLQRDDFAFFRLEFCSTVT